MAMNVEFNASTCGERRRGHTAIDLTGSGIESHDRVTFLHRFLPTNDETEAELWALGVTGTSTSTLVKKASAWSTVSPLDAIILTDNYPNQLEPATLHGKMFVAYKSGQDRLHVWDGTSLRRTGLVQPSPPTAANTGAGGTFSGIRYYRVRTTVQSGGTTLRRSEPSTTLTFTPSGANTGAVITKPAATGESETHWELEASVDDVLYYVIATNPVATTTSTDTQVYTNGYSDIGELSEEIGGYTTIPSGRYLSVDEDRLLIGGSFDDDALASRVSWTPVYNDPGAGNDERIPIATSNFIDLNGYEGGPLTGLSSPVNGYVWAFKWSHIYKLVRTSVRAHAYEAIPISKKYGAIPNSIVEGIDAAGDPALYFLDPHVGPCRNGANGIHSCGGDILNTWHDVNLDADTVICRALYYHEARQVHWWIATDGSDVPNLRIVLQTNETRLTADEGIRKGWTIWNGPSAAALAVCMFSENIDENTARSFVLRPFIARSGSGLVWRGDTGQDDNGTAYAAHIVTKPISSPNILKHFGVMKACIMAKAVAGASLEIVATKDYGLEQLDPITVAFDPAAAETRLVRQLDALSFSELRTLQIEFQDPDVPGARWELDQFALELRQEQS